MKTEAKPRDKFDVWVDQFQGRFGLYGILQVSGWIGYGLIMFIASLPWMGVLEGLLHKSVGAGFGFGFSWPLRGICVGLKRRLEAGQPLALAAFRGLFVLWIFALVWTAAMNGFLWWTRSKDVSGIAWYQYFGGTTSQLFVLLAWVAIYFAISHSIELQRQRESRLKAEGLAREAQLIALQYQIHPHFLFNALNTIATLVLEKDHDRSHRMILNLSDFLRATLEGDPQAEVELREEMELTRRYLTIEAERLGTRLEVEWDVEERALHVSVPSLLLQPLVENAIRHSIARSTGGGKIWIRGLLSRGMLILSVEDWHRDKEIRAGPGSGTGLENIRKRLEHLYEGEAGLNLTGLECGTRVDVKIPEKAGVRC